jgi:CRISPR-associated protein Cas1
MAWRGVHVTQPARLAVADGQLAVDQADGSVRLPLEDVAWIVIDTPQTLLTTSLLSACMDAGIAVVVTDDRHTPSGVMLPFHRHHRQAGVAALQVESSAPLRKRLWQAVVRAKLNNQAAALTECGSNARPILAMAALVGSGDPENVEARAAREYWRRLFPDFTRDDATDKRNAALNYGYAVMRAAVARGAVAAGLLPALGIQHASALNPFNLADDLLEPFRPFVDRAVWRMTSEGRQRDGGLSVEERRSLAALPLEPAIVGRETVTLLVATELAGESLVRAFEAGSASLLNLPQFAAGK